MIHCGAPRPAPFFLSSRAVRERGKVGTTGPRPAGNFFRPPVKHVSNNTDFEKPVLSANTIGTFFVVPKSPTKPVKMIIKYLDSLRPLSDELKEHLTKVITFQRYKKKDIILQQGQVARHIYFIWKGMVRCFYTMDDGQEVSARFMLEGHAVAPILSFFKQVESYETLVAFEDCELYGMSFEDLEDTRQRFVEFNFHAFLLITRNYLESEERLLMIRRRTANERYAILRERWPQLLERVPKRLIASYIDLAPSQMSRKTG